MLAAVIAEVMVIWTAVGYYTNNPYIATLDTVVEECNPNVTISEIPQENK